MKTLQERDFVAAAFTLECEVEAIKAICTVEAPKGGFNPDGSPTTLFEGHKFYKYTQGKYAQSHPTLCFMTWTREHYGRTWQEEQARLQRAMQLDRTAALMSASWGKFQLMGFNYALCGFATLDEFVTAMNTSEGMQLQGFTEFIIRAGLRDELQRHDWKGFAAGYNGASYAQNLYDKKLARAYIEAKSNYQREA